MNEIVFVIVILLAIGVYYFSSKKDPRYLLLDSKPSYKKKIDVTSEVININALVERSYLGWIKQHISLILDMIGERRKLKITLFLVSSILTFYIINDRWLHFPSLITITIGTVTLSIFVIIKLIVKRKKRFYEQFPDALNIMMSAVTAGESVNHAFEYVGRTLNNEVGSEFKDIGERMKLGESSERIFERSCRRFPYIPFLFFVVALRANLARGGQLKLILSRLIRVLAEARSLEKKTLAMTSEARISAKIVGSLPFLFMIAMHFFDPEGLNFVLFEPDGRWVLYYVVGSIGVGMSIIWLLVKGID